LWSLKEDGISSDPKSLQEGQLHLSSFSRISVLNTETPIGEMKGNFSASSALKPRRVVSTCCSY